jgi:hypothetical protein
MNPLRQARIQQLRAEADKLRKKSDELYGEIKLLSLEQSKEEHPCTCVKLNRDIEVFDMQEQERRGRVPLSMGGFVMDNLSAIKNCRECNGTGKPVKQPLHHTCETFNPDTCAACRVIQRNID